MASDNYAQLIQLVRTRLGREDMEGRINVSPCGLVITLDGMVENMDQRLRLESLVRRVPGAEGVIVEVGVSQTV